MQVFVWLKLWRHKGLKLQPFIGFASTGPPGMKVYLKRGVVATQNMCKMLPQKGGSEGWTHHNAETAYSSEKKNVVAANASEI